MRIVKRFTLLLATASLLMMSVGQGTALAIDENHGIGLSKGCIGITRLGDPYRCSYAVSNTIGIDEAGDTLTITSVVDTINRPGSPNSGNILQIPGIGAIVSFDALSGNVTPASCSGLGTAAAICTLPSQSRIRIGGVGGVPGFSFYTTTTTSAVPPASDFDVNPVTHQLTDTVALTWQDTCSSGTNNCPQGNQSATTGSSTTLVKRPSTTVTDIHDAAHAVVLTVPVGTTVHDFVTVTGDPNQPTPSGNVTIDWFLNGDCSGAPAVNSGPVGPLVQGATNSTFDATGFSFTVNTAGMRAFRAHYLGDALYLPSDGACEPLRVVDANIQITPNGVNRVGATHTFTAHVNINDGGGGGFVPAPAGTTITFTNVNTNGANAAAVPPSCTTVGATGSCTTTITSTTTGVSTVSAHTNVTVAGVVLTRDTNGVGANSGPAVKTWVNARISITPNAFNAVGQPHTFVATLLKDAGDGAGFVPAAGEAISITLIPSLGATPTPPGPFNGTTNAAGQFSATFTSPTAGLVVGHAAATLSVAGSAAFSVETDGTGGNSGDANKVFQDANIQITPNGVNHVGDTHTFTGHVNVAFGNSGPPPLFVNAPAGTAISFTIDSGPGAFTSPNPCLTVGATGSCTITMTSAVTGVTVVSAHTTFTTPQGVTLTRHTDGVGANSGPSTKTWVNARISITPSATNEVNQPHTFTVRLEKDPGTGVFVPAAGEHVTVTLTDANGATHTAPTGTCTNAGANTDANGQCVITFTSPTAGTVTGHASSTLSVNGSAPFTVQTNGANGNSGDAVKTFVDANIQITPQTAINPVSTNHTVTGHVNINAGNGLGFVNAPAGTVINFSLTNSGGASASFVGPNTCATVAATGSCTVVINSSLSGTTTIKATTSVVVGGLTLVRTTGDGKLGDSADANKLWADDTVRTDVHDAAHNVITSVTGPISVHDKVFVTRTANTPAAVPNPTGNVVFHRYANLTCTGASVDQTVALAADGTAESSSFTASSSLCYQADYLGDANYPARTGAIEPLTVTILVPNVEIIKFTNGADANDPNAAGVPDIAPNGTVTWTYRVTNTGQTSPDRVDVHVTDNITGVTPVFDSVITGNADTIFQPGEVWLYKATGIALDLAVAPPPSGTVIVPGVCTQGGTRPPANAYTNVGTVTIPGATDQDPSSYCNPQELPCPAGSFSYSVAANGDLLIKYDQFPAPNDNSYGVNAVGWGSKGHTFGNLTGSDKAGFQLVDPGGSVVLDFTIDSISAKTGTPSGYGSLGPFGGDGDVNVGTLTPADIVYDTAISRNLNNTGYFVGGVQVVGNAVANLLVDSPPTLNTVDSYVLTPAAAAVFTAPNPDSAESPGWNFHNTFFVTIKAAKLAALGFNAATWKVQPNEDELHNSPAKPCPCPTGVGDPAPTITVQNNANGTTTITYAQSLAVNDNSYGTGTDPTWAGKGHTFSNLLGSDKLNVVITQGGVEKYDFVLDYISAKTGTPSGYGSLGPTGGDGSLSTGNLADITNWTTSLDADLNIACPPPSGPWTTNSPTSPGGAGCPAWNFVNSYTVTVKGTFSASEIAFPTVHNSPAKPNVCPTGGGGGPSACNLTVTKTELHDKEVKITIKNNSKTDAVLSSINNLTWPASNGKLMEIKLDGESLYKPAGGVSSVPATLGVPPLKADPNKREIKKGSSDVLKFVFQNKPSGMINPGATVSFEGCPTALPIS